MSNYFHIKITTKDTQTNSNTIDVLHSESPIDYTLKTDSDGVVVITCYDKDYVNVLVTELSVINSSTNEVTGARLIVTNGKII